MRPINKVIPPPPPTASVHPISRKQKQVDKRVSKVNKIKVGVLKDAAKKGKKSKDHLI